jgi:hypothetical protein
MHVYLGARRMSHREDPSTNAGASGLWLPTDQNVAFSIDNANSISRILSISLSIEDY